MEAGSHDGLLVQHEFITLCIDCFWSAPLPRIRTCLESYLEARKRRAQANANKWKEISRNIDHYSRYLVSLGYLTCVTIIMNVDFIDAYQDNAAAPMYQGLYKTSMTWAGVLESLI